MRTKAGILVGSGDQSQTDMVSQCPPPFSLLCWPGVKIWKGVVHAVKIMIHYQYKFLGVIRILGNLRTKNSCN